HRSATRRSSPPRRSTGAFPGLGVGPGPRRFQAGVGPASAREPAAGQGGPATFYVLPWPWRSAGAPRQHGEEHLNKPLHPHIPERTAIMVQPKLGGERPPSSGSWGRAWKIPEKSFPANGAAPLRGELFSGK